eukprot:366228-Chlamydomonas_euryale.AAC.39
MATTHPERHHLAQSDASVRGLQGNFYTDGCRHRRLSHRGPARASGRQRHLARDARGSSPSGTQLWSQSDNSDCSKMSPVRVRCC